VSLQEYGSFPRLTLLTQTPFVLAKPEAQKESSPGRYLTVSLLPTEK